MAHIIPTVGRNWLADKAVFDSTDATVNTVAVGSGTTAPSASDTQLDNELYRDADDSGNITVERTSATGEIRCTIAIRGDSEVPASSEIWEFGCFASDGTLIYRELRDNAVVIDAGDTKVFEFKLTVTQ